MSEIITKLSVDSSGAVVDLKKFADAMTAAGDASAKTVATMTSGPGSVDQAAKTWQKLQASTDPVFAAQVKQQSAVEAAFKTANSAVAAGLITHEQAAAQVQKVSDKYSGLVSAAQNAAFSQTTLGKTTEIYLDYLSGPEKNAATFGK